MEWKPIETAPKDGRHIVANVRGELQTIFWDDDHWSETWRAEPIYNNEIRGWLAVQLPKEDAK